jgi:hypothetical protein
MEWKVDQLKEPTNPPDLFTAVLAAVRGIDHLVGMTTRLQAEVRQVTPASKFGTSSLRDLE